MAEAHPTSLYRYFDEHDILLYVGITSRGISRNREHDKSKPWWLYVARQEVDHFRDRLSAQGAERATIQKYRPPFNVQHNPDHAKTQAAYHALRTRSSLPLRLDVEKLRGTVVALDLTLERLTQRRAVRWFCSAPLDQSVAGLVAAPTNEISAQQVKVGGVGKNPAAVVWVNGATLMARVESTISPTPDGAFLRFRFASHHPPRLRPHSLTY